MNNYNALYPLITFYNALYINALSATNIPNYYQYWKKLHHIFVEIMIIVFWILWWIESSKEQHLFEKAISANIQLHMNVLINVNTTNYSQLLVFINLCGLEM